jgi:choline kinase
MKAVILCAGLGSRTGLKYPKCLFKFDDGSTLLSKNIDSIKKYGFKNDDIILATGFKSSLIQKETNNLFKYVKNFRYAKTNMVYSFNEVLKKYKDHDYYIFYADIIFDSKNVGIIKKSKNDISTIVDSDWLEKWKLKKNYLDDLEELKIHKSKISKLGKKVKKIDGIDGRFVGITKFSKKIVRQLIKKKILKNILKENKKIDLTNFLMYLINYNYEVIAIKKKVNWFEFDEYNDFKKYLKR